MNKNLFDKIFNEYYIKALMLIMSILYCVPFFMESMDLLINIVLGYSALFVVYDLIRHRDILKTRFVIFGILYLAAFSLTIVTHQFQSVDIKVAVYMFMQLILFTCCASYKTADEIKKEMFNLFKVVIFIGFVYEIISFAMYAISYFKVFVTSVMDMSLIIGKHPNSSLYGIMGNSNWYSFFNITCTGLSLIMLTTNTKHRKYYSSVIIMSVISLFLTNSRGGLIGFCVFTTLYILYCVFTNNNRNMKKYLLVPLVAIMVFPVSSVTSLVLNKTSDIITNVVYIDEEEQSNKVGRELAEQEASTSIRLSLWKTSARVITENPILGVGNANVGREMFLRRADKYAISSKTLAGNSHNIYIQIALISGILGLFLWLAYLTSNIWFMFWKLIHSNVHKDVEKTIAVIGCLLLSYLVINLVEADIFISRNFMSTIFWILLGYGICLTQFTCGVDRKKIGIFKIKLKK